MLQFIYIYLCIIIIYSIYANYFKILIGKVHLRVYSFLRSINCYFTNTKFNIEKADLALHIK